jgi:diacylglycerol kinase (ATP)
MVAESESVYMIANPRAGRIQRKKRLVEGSFGAKCVWEETRGAGHAEALAYEASLRGFRWIVAVGGDGTIHEVLNGILRNLDNQSILGLIPAGTANDYAASFTRNDPTDPTTPLRVDAGCLRWEGGCRYFANVAGLGFSGEIARRARQMLRIPARMRYTLALLRQLGPSYGPQGISVSFDGDAKIETETLLMSAAIGKREGSYPLHGQADLSDGLFEVLRLGRLSRRELAWHFPAMLRGVLPRNHPEVQRKRCRRIEVASPVPVPIHVDGEFPRGADPGAFTRFSLEIIPQALQASLLQPSVARA